MSKLKLFIIIFSSILIQTINAQVFKSIHQKELEYYSTKSISDIDYYNINKNLLVPTIKTAQNCTLNKVVFGWHPYWSNGLESNYNWNLLTDLSYFGYEVNPSTGNASNTHSWATAAVVDSALANGVRVNLCATLFSSHATFFGSTTSQQTLITNLISLIQQRNANGVNIDFESVPSANKNDLTNFMINLCNQMHTAIPGSKISMAIPAVDWSGNYDVTVMYPYVDLFLIMGYDYYYSSSAQAGPTDPLYTHISTYNYNISKSVTYYLNKGVPGSKLALGLPYYGIEWSTSSSTVPSSTTSTGVSRTYKYVRDNSTGYYTNPVNYNKTMSTYYAFNDGSTWKQCFITDAHMMGRRFDLVNQRNLAGIGIWALGYDDGYNDLWQTISNKFTSCATIPCQDTIYDMGGPQGNYFNNENYTYTISPSGASGVSLSFNSFNVTSGSDTLKIYNGNSINAPLMGNFTGTNSPGNIVSSGNTLTLSFKSGSGSTSSGWEAFWSCSEDTIPPSTSIALSNQWVNNDFVVNFNDIDNLNGSGIGSRFYQVSDYNGSSWIANSNRGFLCDNFTVLNNQIWTTASNGGNWTINNNTLQQTDETNSNTNIYAPLNQTLSNTYLYHFNAKIEGTDANKRFGFHFFCDSASYSNRKNSYFIWFRQSSNTLELYKVTNDVFSIIKSFPNIITNTSQWYDIKIIYDRITGEIIIYRNNVLIGTYTDSNPFSSNGNYISFRSGNCQMFVDSINVYRTRTASPTILVGSSNNKDLRYESPNTQTKAGKIKSIVSDNAYNLSTLAYADVYIDYSPPANINWVNDGLASDIDTTTSASSLSANWASSSDNNTGIIAYWYAIGTASGDSNIVLWTNNGLNSFVTHTGLNLINGSIYYFSVRSQNGAGFFCNTASSDGQTVIITTTVVSSSFSWSSDSICSGDSIHFINQSSNANSYLWHFQGGSPSSSTAANPVVAYNAPGSYQTQLIAYGNTSSDTSDITAFIHVFQNTIADFSSADTVYMPNSYVMFNNTSTNASSYLWVFGDGTYSNDLNPWHFYGTQGIFTVTLFTTNTYCHDSISKTICVLNNNAIQQIVNDNQIIIFPNPFINDFTIEINTTQNTTFNITLSDVYGHELYNSKPEYKLAGKYLFHFNSNLITLTSGIYLLNININKVNTKYKLIKL